MKNITDVRAGSITVSPVITVGFPINIAISTQIGLFNITNIWQTATTPS